MATLPNTCKSLNIFQHVSDTYTNNTKQIAMNVNAGAMTMREKPEESQNSVFKSRAHKI